MDKISGIKLNYRHDSPCHQGATTCLSFLISIVGLTRRATLRLIANNAIQKGNVLVTAELAGIMAAKRTHEIIPLCHMLPLSQITVKAEPRKDGIEVTAQAIYTGRTGVEMEALTAVSAALLTIYDMVKAVDKKMVIGEIKLLSKTKKALAR